MTYTERSRELYSRGMTHPYLSTILLLITSVTMAQAPFRTAAAQTSGRRVPRVASAPPSTKQPMKAAAWPAPKQLLIQLDQLATRAPATRTWVSTAKQLIDVISDPSQDARQRAVTLQQLGKHRDQLNAINAQVWKTTSSATERTRLSADIVRLHYRLSRRMEVWHSVLSMPARGSVSDLKGASQPVAFGRLNFDGLDQQWVDYLLLNDYKTAFEGLNSSKELKRATARRVLARIYSPALQPQQALFARSVFDGQVIDFLKSVASEPVSAADLLRRMEYYETDASARAGHYLNERYQDLLWSDNENDRRIAAVLDAHYRNANFRLTISSKFMNRLLPQLPTIAEPVSETIKGALVSGQSQVSNQVNVNLIPDPNRLNLHVETQGQVLSDTMARTKSVRVFNQGMAWFNVTKPITVDRNGIDASQKAYSTSRAQQVLVDIQSNMDNMPLIGNFIRRVAENRVREETPETNQLFRRRVAAQAEQRVEEILAGRISKVEQDAQKYLLQPLLELNLDPEPIQLATTEEKIVMRYRLAGRDQMAANTSRPEDPRGNLVSIQVHQSLLNNGISRIGLNENTFDSQQLTQHLQNVLGLSPPDKATSKEPDPRSKDAKFTFAKFDPVRVEFVNDRINISLNLTKLVLRKNGRPLKNITMKASYQLAADGMQVQLIQDDEGTRIGRIGGRGRDLTIGERGTISTAMKVLFKKEYSFNALPEQFRAHDQAKNLMITQLVLSDGWIGVSLNDRVQAANNERILDRLPNRLGNLRRALERK